MNNRRIAAAALAALSVAALTACNQQPTPTPTRPSSTAPVTSPAPSPTTTAPKPTTTGAPTASPTSGAPTTSPKPTTPTPTTTKPTTTAPQPGGTLSVDLRVDANRDGQIDMTGTTDAANKRQASIKQGALFLPNLDDDAKRCKTKDAAGKPLARAALLACNDAQDDIVNGADDAADLAKIKAAPMAALGANATVTVTTDAKSKGRVKLFYLDGANWKIVPANGRIPAAVAKAGLTLGLEGTQAMVDKAVWDGKVTVTLAVSDAGKTGTDSVMLQHAPILAFHHKQQTTRIATTNNDAAYAKRLGAAVAAAKKDTQFTVIPSDLEMWTQDQFEPMMVSMPSANGAQSMVLNIIPGVHRRDTMGYFSLKSAGVGFVQLGTIINKEDDNNSAHYMGNLEVLPPHKGFPHGRLVFGDWTNDPKNIQKMRPELSKFIAAQELQGPAISINPGWLTVGHVDEIFTTVPANNALGWKLFVADPDAAVKIAETLQKAGKGGQKLTSTPQDEFYAPPINEFLDPLHRKHSTSAAAKINEAIAEFKRTTGITDADIVRVPVAFMPDREVDPNTGEEAKPNQPGGLFRMKPALPNAVNSAVMGNGKVLVAKQFGQTLNGADPFEKAVIDAYRTAGQEVIFVDDRPAQSGGGNVHCTVAITRDGGKWWNIR